MTLSAWMIYAADVCTSLCVAANIGIFLSLTVLFLALVTWPALHEYVRLIAWTLAACLIVSIFVPSGKVLAAMYVLPAIVNSAAVQELPREVVEAARAYIRDMLPKAKDSK